MKKVSLLALSIGVISIAFTACNNSNDSVKRAENVNERKDDQNLNAVDVNDAEFVVDAAEGGMFEVELGKLARDKAVSQEVKDFAEMMVNDHSNANEKLKTLADRKNITLPTMLSNKNMDHKNELSKKNGNDFDKAYISLMVKDHKNDIDKYEKATRNVKDPELNSFANETLPTLRAHLDHCQTIEDKIK